MSREDEVRKLQQSNKTMTSHEASMNTGQLIVGVIIILVGLAFLSMIMTKSAGADLIPRQAVPILVFLGGVLMTGAGKAAEGLGLMVLGLLFILRNMGLVPTETFDIAWFGILALVGLVLVLRAQLKKG